MKVQSLFRQPDGELFLGEYLRKQLAIGTGWTEFRAAVAFVKHSGLRHLLPELANFAATGSISISVGIGLQGTSKEGLEALLHRVVAVGGEVWVFHNAHPSSPTFHPKIYLFKKPGRALLILGSGNLTAGGLFSNYEAGIVLELDLADENDLAVLKQAEAALQAWCDPSSGLARALTKELLEKLVSSEMVPPEAKARGDASAKASKTSRGASLFAEVKVPKPPPPKKFKATVVKLVGGGLYRGFLMTLQRTDVGVGQVTPGTSRRSPEIFIPLAARDEDKDFWGWPHLFTEDSAKPGKHDRLGVRMNIGGTIAKVNVMTWPVKHDFRLRSEVLRSAGKVGDIIRIERAEKGAGFDYYVEIIPRGTSEYAKRQAQCVRRVRNSKKCYGYY